MIKKTAAEFLIEGNYFTEEEITLVECGWGQNEDTYNTICQVRFAQDVDQIVEEYNEGLDEEDQIEIDDPFCNF